ncbi:DUF1642 domain-containing protein [Streptococcus sp. A23]|uniref:DUF1642 domain-containing protein n=1 Tax=Streptococcus sp. A23 TaxID=3373127 RepID=UPI00374CCC00
MQREQFQVPYGPGIFVHAVFADKAIELINQIHEPQKVVVPKFVAEWYERNKDDLNTAIYSTITRTYRKVNGENDDLLDTFESWLVYQENSILILVQMQLFGFEIEQEKLYEVTVPGTSNYKNQRQHLVKQGKHWFFCGNDVNRFKYRFTKGQIEAAGFGWVFDCKGVKVEEVEEN